MAKEKVQHLNKERKIKQENKSIPLPLDIACAADEKPKGGS